MRPAVFLTELWATVRGREIEPMIESPDLRPDLRVDRLEHEAQEVQATVKMLQTRVGRLERRAQPRL